MSDAYKSAPGDDVLQVANNQSLTSVRHQSTTFKNQSHTSTKNQSTSTKISQLQSKSCQYQAIKKQNWMPGDKVTGNVAQQTKSINVRWHASASLAWISGSTASLSELTTWSDWSISKAGSLSATLSATLSAVTITWSTVWGPGDWWGSTRLRLALLTPCGIIIMTGTIPKNGFIMAP